MSVQWIEHPAGFKGRPKLTKWNNSETYYVPVCGTAGADPRFQQQEVVGHCVKGFTLALSETWLPIAPPAGSASSPWLASSCPGSAHRQGISILAGFAGT